jgi:hypothetical protein
VKFAEYAEKARNLYVKWPGERLSRRIVGRHRAGRQATP